MSARSNYQAATEAVFEAAQPKLKALAARVKAAPDAERAAVKAHLILAQSKHDEALHLYELLKRAGPKEWSAMRIPLGRLLSELRAALARVV